MLVEGIANELCGGGGHGASASRRLGDRATLLRELMTQRAGAVKQVLRGALVDAERGTDHLRAQLLQKQKSGASYAAIEEFRKDFLVPWAGGKKLIQRAKRLLAFQDAFFMHCGPKWQTIDIVAREARIDAYRAEINKPDRRAAYLKYISAQMG